VLARIAATVLLITCAVGAHAQTPYRVRDIYPGPYGSDPTGATDVWAGQMSRVGGLALFTAHDPEQGHSLWCSDGTREGTKLLREFSVELEATQVSQFTEAGDRTYFRVQRWRAEDLVSSELWTTDGSPEGTLVVKVWTGGYIDSLTASGSALFFAASTESGYGLWKSDGTEAGTILVSDEVIPYGGFVGFGDGVMFYGLQMDSGWELWRSDGTESGTALVKDIQPGFQSSSPDGPKALWNGLVFFAATREAEGNELWVTDGTEAGTRLVIDLIPGLASSAPRDLAVRNGVVYFSAKHPTEGRELYRTDGTAAGTVRLSAIPGPEGPGPTLEAGGLTFFASMTEWSGTNEPYRTDGTPEGTLLLRDINPGDPGSGPWMLGGLAGKMYFKASDPLSGAELWRTDGTAAGTALVRDTSPGPADFASRPSVVVGDRLFFVADDGTSGKELWAVQAGAPEVDAGPDHTVADGESVSFEGSATDPEGDPLTFEWRDQNDVLLASSAIFSVTLPAGFHELTLAASDGAHTSFDTLFVRVGMLLKVNVSSQESGKGRVEDGNGGACESVPSGVATCELYYAPGSLVTLSAIPKPGSTFLWWTGACQGTGTCQVTVAEAQEVQATFKGPRGLDLFLDVGGAGMGSVQVDPLDLVCKITTPGVWETCMALVQEGTSLLITPIPAPGSVFQGWVPGDGPCTGTGPCNLTMNDHTSLRPLFVGPGDLLLTLASQENGLGSVVADPPGAPCELSAPGTTQCSHTYPANQVVVLTAIPAPGSVFAGWSGMGCSGVGTCTQTMSDHQSVRATFAGLRTLTTTLSGQQNGAGTVTVNPPGSVCTFEPPSAGTACDNSYTPGQVVTVTATPAPGSVFTGWSGACSGTQACVVTMSGPKTVGATFLGPRTLETTAYGVAGGTGSVVVTPPGSSCVMPAAGNSTTCVTTHQNGQFVTLTAVAGPGSKFERWEDACTGSGPCTIGMSVNRRVRARFAGPPRLLLYVRGIAGGVGSVVSDPPGSTCAVTTPGSTHVCTEYYSYGQVVTLTPQPSPPGFVFTGWSGSALNCPGTGPCAVTMSADRTVSANFHAIRTLSITVVSEDGGAGKASPYGVDPDCVVTPSTSPTVCQHTYPSGTVVMMSASAAPGSYLAGWTGDCSGTSQCSPQLIQDTSVTAVFRRSNQLPTVSLISPASGSTLAAGVPTIVRASAADPDGLVARVDFFVTTGVVLGSDTAPPYEVTWVPPTPGPYVLIAQVTDNVGATVLSSTVSVTAAANQAPALSVTSPPPGAVFVAPATVTLSADASDPDGTITRVEFFEGATSRGFDTTSPYSVTWSDVAAGNHALTAVATDNSGATTTVPFTVAVGASVGATADTFVRDGTYASTNYGGASTLDVRKVTTVGHNRRAFFRFAVDSVPTVTSARLRLFGRLTGTQSFPVQALVFAVADTSWGESTMTWNNQPPTAPTPLGGVVLHPNPSNEQWYEWDVTAHVQAAKAAGQTAVTLAVEEDVYAQGAAFRARTAAVGMRPQLILTP
jgi:uncharacterized repeat protein (TIGR02543 family)